MHSWYETLNNILGLEAQPKDLTLGQTCLRASIVFIAALVMVRMGSKRFLSKMSAVDAILGFILASMLARAVNGSAAFFPSLIAGFLLVGLHRVVVYLACVSHRFGNLVKGHCAPVVERGKVNEATMHKHNLTEEDLLEEMRLNGNLEDLQKVKAAYLERSGKISVVKEE